MENKSVVYLLCVKILIVGSFIRREVTFIKSNVQLVLCLITVMILLSGLSGIFQRSPSCTRSDPNESKMRNCPRLIIS